MEQGPSILVKNQEGMSQLLENNASVLSQDQKSKNSANQNRNLGYDQNVEASNSLPTEEKGKKHPHEHKKNLTTLDSERPPSGYSEYSYSYEYSEGEEVVPPDQNNNNNNQNQNYNCYFMCSDKSSRAPRKKNYIPRYLMSRVNKPQLPQEELEELKNKAINFEPLDDLTDDQYEALIRHLAEERRDNAFNNNFAYSEKLNEVIEYVTECQTDQRKYALQQSKYDDYFQQMERVQSELERFDQETSMLEKKLKSDLETQQRRIEANQERELDRHSAQWTSDAKRKQYNHASSRLLFLRKQFQQLVVQCRFKEASAIKSEIQKLELAEQQEAIKVMQHKYDESLKKIETRHADELQFFKTRADIQLKQLKQNRAKLRIALQNKESKLRKMEERIKDVEKLWNCNQMQRIEDVSAGKSRDARVTSKLSPREFCNQNDTTINLPPLNLRRNPTRASRQ